MQPGRGWDLGIAVRCVLVLRLPSPVSFQTFATSRCCVSSLHVDILVVECSSASTLGALMCSVSVPRHYCMIRAGSGCIGMGTSSPVDRGNFHQVGSTRRFHHNRALRCLEPMRGIDWKVTVGFPSAHEAVPEKEVKSCGYSCFRTILVEPAVGTPPKYWEDTGKRREIHPLGAVGVFSFSATFRRCLE